MISWTTTPDLEKLNALRTNTICDVLDITFDAFDDESITASMVVDHRTHQPFGLLHGGASVVLAETLGSMASFLCVDTTKFYCVGLEVTPTTCAPYAAAGSLPWLARFIWAVPPMCGISA